MAYTFFFPFFFSFVRICACKIVRLFGESDCRRSGRHRSAHCRSVRRPSAGPSSVGPSAGRYVVGRYVVGRLVGRRYIALLQILLTPPKSITFSNLHFLKIPPSVSSFLCGCLTILPSLQEKVGCLSYISTLFYLSCFLHKNLVDCTIRIFQSRAEHWHKWYHT